MGALRFVNGKIVRRETGKVINCDNCGSCCMHMGTPPGYAAFYPVDGQPRGSWTAGSEDEALWEAMPQVLRDELGDYYRRVQSGELFDRSHGYVAASRAFELIQRGELRLAREAMADAAGEVPIPCLWFDTETRRCKHYEHRPSTCRDPEVMAPGNDACLSTRKVFRIPLPQV